MLKAYYLIAILAAVQAPPAVAAQQSKHLTVSLDGHKRELVLYIDKAMLAEAAAKEKVKPVEGSSGYDRKWVEGIRLQRMAPPNGLVLDAVYRNDKFGDLPWKVHTCGIKVNFDVQVDIVVKHGKFVTSHKVVDSNTGDLSGLCMPLNVLNVAVAGLGSLVGDPRKLTDHVVDGLVEKVNGGAKQELLDFGESINKLYKSGELSAKSVKATEGGVALSFTFNIPAIELLTKF